MLQRLRRSGRRHGKNLAAIARCVALGQIYSELDAARDQAHLERAAAACGVVFETEPDDVQEIFLWPENVECWNLFHQEFSTQWLEGTELAEQRGRADDYQAAIREQNRATEVLARETAAARARGQVAQRQAAAAGKRYDAALAQMAGARVTTCADAMPFVNKLLEDVR